MEKPTSIPQTVKTAIEAFIRDEHREFRPDVWAVIDFEGSTKEADEFLVAGQDGKERRCFIATVHRPFSKSETYDVIHLDECIRRFTAPQFHRG